MYLINPMIKYTHTKINSFNKLLLFEKQDQSKLHLKMISDGVSRKISRLNIFKCLIQQYCQLYSSTNHEKLSLELGFVGIVVLNI